MLQAVVRLLLAIVLGTTLLIGVGFLGAIIMMKDNSSFGPGLSILVSVGTVYTAPLLVFGCLLLAILTWAASEKLGRGERTLAFVVSACGLLFLRQFER
jgi:hypothetical protein